MIFTFADTVRNINDVVEHLLKTAQENGIEIKGHFIYGRDSDMQSSFIEEFKSIANALSSQYDKYIPMAHIYGVTNNFYNLLTESQKEIKQAKAILNTYISSQKTCSVEWANVKNRCTNMINTFNNRCAGSTFCGGAEHALSTDINHMISSLNQLMDAYSAINADNLVNYGQLVSYINDLEEKEKAIESLKNEMKSNILNLFEQ